jgi:hypothetical protein
MQETTLVQRAYTAVVEHFIKTGRAPHYSELAAASGCHPKRLGRCSVRQLSRR